MFNSTRWCYSTARATLLWTANRQIYSSQGLEELLLAELPQDKKAALCGNTTIRQVGRAQIRHLSSKGFSNVTISFLKP